MSRVLGWLIPRVRFHAKTLGVGGWPPHGLRRSWHDAVVIPRRVSRSDFRFRLSVHSIDTICSHLVLYDVAVRPLWCSSPLQLRHIQCLQLQLQLRHDASAAAVVDIGTVLRDGVAGWSTVDLARTSRQPSGTLGARARQTADEAVPTARCSRVQWQQAGTQPA